MFRGWTVCVGRIQPAITGRYRITHPLGDWLAEGNTLLDGHPWLSDPDAGQVQS